MLVHSELWILGDVLRSGADPIAGAWNRQSRGASRAHLGRDQHGFIARKNSLTECNALTAVVHSRDSSRSVHAVWLVGEWLGSLSIRVAVASSILPRLAFRYGIAISRHTIDIG